MNKKTKILIIDDNQTILDLLRAVLTINFDCDIHTSSDPCKSIELARSIHPDIIILDIVMPDKSGDEVAHEIMEYIEFENTKIIFFSGMISNEEAERYNSTHKKQICVPKSSKSSVLINHIRNIISSNNWTNREILHFRNLKEMVSYADDLIERYSIRWEEDYKTTEGNEKGEKWSQ